MAALSRHPLKSSDADERSVAVVVRITPIEPITNAQGIAAQRGRNDTLICLW